MYLSHRTIGTHLFRIFPKLGMTSRGEMPEPEVLARQLHLLYDGRGQSAQMDHDPTAAVAARAAAATLLDAALARGTTAPLST